MWASLSWIPTCSILRKRRGLTDGMKSWTEHVPETEEWGVSSTVFESGEALFHPERLDAVIKGFEQDSITRASGEHEIIEAFRGIWQTLCRRPRSLLSHAVEHARLRVSVFGKLRIFTIELFPRTSVDASRNMQSIDNEGFVCAPLVLQVKRVASKDPDMTSRGRYLFYHKAPMVNQSHSTWPNYFRSKARTPASHTSSYLEGVILTLS